MKQVERQNPAAEIQTTHLTACATWAKTRLRSCITLEHQPSSSPSPNLNHTENRRKHLCLLTQSRSPLNLQHQLQALAWVGSRPQSQQPTWGLTQSKRNLNIQVFPLPSLFHSGIAVLLHSQWRRAQKAALRLPAMCCMILSRSHHAVSSGSSLLWKYCSSGISSVIVNYSGGCISAVKQRLSANDRRKWTKPFQELPCFRATNRSTNNETKWWQESPRKLLI